MKPILLSLTLLLAALPSRAAAPVALFYLTTGPDSVRSFLAHSKQIDLLVPTWYSVDENGLVTGAPDPTVLKRADEDHVPLMPIVAMFNKKGFHTLSTSAAAAKSMTSAMIRECQLHHYTGFQLDLENIDYLDRDNLTALVKFEADALHAAGLQLSIATVPNAPGYPGAGPFAKWIYTDWRGAYDIAALAKSVDLLCLMTYDQNTRWTMPGPVAGWDWTQENLDYALKTVPKAKLSLGIPLYGYHWYAGAPTHDPNPAPGSDADKPNPTGDYIGYPNAMQLAASYNGKVQWDADDHTAFFYFYRDQMREWIFFTDLHTFKDRYELVQKSGIQGFCSWVLGEEDPAIWNYLPRHQ
jgi:spore germination protein YaaH